MMVHALVVAAGKGSRFGAGVPKQYTKVGQKTLLEHTIDALNNSEHIRHIHLVVAPDDSWVTQLSFALPVTFVIGGEARWQSVQAGVQALASTAQTGKDLVLIHDAARPCIHPADINAVVQVAKQEKHGAILGTPCTDTLKKVTSTYSTNSHSANKPNTAYANQPCMTQHSLIIEKTLDRSEIWAAQTPQVFRYAKLGEVLDYVERHTLSITDEASAFEHLDLPIKMVASTFANPKLTYPADAPIIQFLLQGQHPSST